MGRRPGLAASVIELRLPLASRNVMIKAQRARKKCCENCHTWYTISSAFLSPEKFCSNSCEDGEPVRPALKLRSRFDSAPPHDMIAGRR